MKERKIWDKISSDIILKNINNLKEVVHLNFNSKTKTIFIQNAYIYLVQKFLISIFYFLFFGYFIILWRHQSPKIESNFPHVQSLLFKIYNL